MICADYHTHTTYSHGSLTPREVIEIAVEAGLKRIAISEHAPSMSYGLKPDDFLNLKAELDDLRREYPIEILLGIEANFLGDGKLDLPRDIPFDVVIAGYHRSIPLKTPFSQSALLQSFTRYSVPDKNTDEIIRTLDNYPEVQILAHPNEYIRLNVRRIAKYAASRGLLLEINNRHVTMSVDDLKAAADEGARFVINSDGHTREEMCRFDKALQRAKEAGVTDLVTNLAQD